MCIRNILVYQTKLGSTHEAKPSCQHWVVVKESMFIGGPNRQNRHLMLKRPELPDGFQGRVFKDSVRREGHRVSAHAQSSDWLVMR